MYILIHALNLTAVQLNNSSLKWRHNGRDGVSNHQPHGCLLSGIFRRRLKKTSKLRVTGLCAGNSTVTGEFPAQMASNAENVSIWWRHHVTCEHEWMIISHNNNAMQLLIHALIPVKRCKQRRVLPGLHVFISTFCVVLWLVTVLWFTCIQIPVVDHMKYIYIYIYVYICLTHLAFRFRI